MKNGPKKVVAKREFLDVESPEDTNKRLGLLLPKPSQTPAPLNKADSNPLKKKLKDAAFDVVIDDVSSQLLRPFLLTISATLAILLPPTTPLSLFITALAAPFAISFALKFSFKLGKKIVKKCANIIEKEMIKNALLETSEALKKAGYVVYENASHIVFRKKNITLNKPMGEESSLKQSWDPAYEGLPPLLLSKPSSKRTGVLIEEIEPAMAASKSLKR